MSRSQLGRATWDDPSAYSNDLRPNYKNLTFYGSRGGTVVANGATAVVVANPQITANSIVLFTLKTAGGTPAGAPYLSAATPGTGFSVKAAAGDTSTYNYMIIELDLV